MPRSDQHFFDQTRNRIHPRISPSGHLISPHGGHVYLLGRRARKAHVADSLPRATRHRSSSRGRSVDQIPKACTIPTHHLDASPRLQVGANPAWRVPSAARTTVRWGQKIHARRVASARRALVPCAVQRHEAVRAAKCRPKGLVRQLNGRNSVTP